MSKACIPARGRFAVTGRSCIRKWGPHEVRGTNLPMVAGAGRVDVGHVLTAPSQAQSQGDLVSWSVDAGGHVFPANGGAADEAYPHVIVDRAGTEWTVREVETPQPWARGANCLVAFNGVLLFQPRLRIYVAVSILRCFLIVVQHLDE